MYSALRVFVESSLCEEGGGVQLGKGIGVLIIGRHGRCRLMIDETGQSLGKQTNARPYA